MNVKEIKELVKLLSGTDVTELDLETEGMKITIKKSLPNQPASPNIHPAAAVPLQQLPSQSLQVTVTPEQLDAAADEIVPGPNQTLIVAPMVGTFYRAPSPEADPYVQSGETIEQGQIVCIIEAMKLMNEIESECRGRILDILVENAQPVEYGQPLFLLEKL